MVKYSVDETGDKTTRARGSYIRVHYKNTHETAMALKGMELKKAQTYLRNVLAHKDVIPFRVHTGGVSRTPQAKKYGVSMGRWPEKSCRVLLDLLQNAESNAEFQGLEAGSLYVQHIQVQRAPKQRRRTYRAHGRINPYMASPCHINMILASKEEGVKPAKTGALQARKRAPRLTSGVMGF